ncbi:MAG: membrane protein insertase YidC [Gemmatimonadota bacterium]
MKTEARFLLAVMLMLGVLVGTNRLFPPVVPDVVPDSLAGEEGDTTAAASGVADLPTLPGTAQQQPTTEETVDPIQAPPAEDFVTVEGPLYRYTFSTAGARLISGELLAFDALNRGGPVELVPDGSEGFLGQKLVVGSDTVDLSRAPYSVEPAGGLRLNENSGPQSLRFTYQPSDAFAFVVEYVFEPNQYTVAVSGRSMGVDRALLLTDLGAGLAFAEADSALEVPSMAYVYNHQANGIRSEILEKAEPEVVNGPLLWGAFRSKFFVVALLAGDDEEASPEDLLGGLLVQPSPLVDRVRVAAAQTIAGGDYSYRLYLGPQQYALLSSLGQDMQEVNPYGWRFFRPIVRPFVSLIMTVLNFLHDNLSLGYGWVLIVFGVAMRVVLFPLNHKAMRAQLRNMAVQPLVQEIQAKHKDNPEKLQKEMMKLYKEHGFNPLAGCLPMLLPWPVLIALFFVFQNTIELRGVPFLWLPDLSAKDPLYLLPIIMAASMFLIQWISLRSIEQTNPQMKMMMYIMPPMMLVIFLNLPSGLNLYYATANIATLPQQIWIAGERKKMRGQPPPKLSDD